jgi:hypothetical protein
MEMEGKVRVPVKRECLVEGSDVFRRYVELDGERHYVGVKRTEDLSEAVKVSNIKRFVAVGDKEFYLYSVVRIHGKEYPVERDDGTEFIEVDE